MVCARGANGAEMVKRTGVGIVVLILLKSGGVLGLEGLILDLD